ncbi:hypothetical protein NE865_05813 [Phthorimaea operculella]|nr:hypothetical protein NE865_05813 [Phthorimaea operculella]
MKTKRQPIERSRLEPTSALALSMTLQPEAARLTPPGARARKLPLKQLRYNSYFAVLLFPEEGWARSASSSYWTLQPCWWKRSRCKVVEVAGTRRHSTHARMVVSGGNAVHIVGTFKHLGTDADFKLYLTTNVTQADFNMGYTMTGTLERGCKSTNNFQVTHFAVLRRCDHDAHHLKNN